jgi:hypothetical protein
MFLLIRTKAIHLSSSGAQGSYSTKKESLRNDVLANFNGFTLLG